ncbi:Nitric oxide synthase, inducible [Saguinus oedipus]|uniref:Nitric oxide synthase, inducible n=1 Tax=Saguinus oedipus TaxID=9490 RepID=A0ABQ9VSJ2_SAGOE|nr:Nitric oxide synthase, inducible [Saguinus oedipus]
MVAVSFHSPVAQDDPLRHSLSKLQNESPQPFMGTGKKSPESLVKLDAIPSSCPRHVRIKNWGSGMTFQDTLHHKAKGEPHWIDFALDVGLAGEQGRRLNPE